MIRRQFQIFIDRAPEDVFDFHADLKNLSRISPPEQEEEAGGILPPGPLRVGSQITIKSAPRSLRRNMESIIVEWDPPEGFTERQVRGPFPTWTHQRRFAAFQGGTLMTDQIEYEPPGGAVGAFASRFRQNDPLERFFHYRQAEAKRILEQFGRIKGRQEERRLRAEATEDEDILPAAPAVPDIWELLGGPPESSEIPAFTFKPVRQEEEEMPDSFDETETEVRPDELPAETDPENEDTHRSRLV